MRDPLILEARLELDSWGDWRGGEGRGITFCDNGVWEWFERPRQRPLALFAILNPYREGFRLHRPRWGRVEVDAPDGNRIVSPFVVSTSTWISRWVNSHPRFNYYINIEVEHVEQGKRVRSRVRPARLVHAASGTPNAGGLDG